MLVTGKSALDSHRGMVQQTNGSENGVHATGQPDTPVECLVDILDRALQASDMHQMKALVEHAYSLASGLDPYLDVISTPPSKVDWHRMAHLVGDTLERLVCVCCAESYLLAVAKLRIGQSPLIIYAYVSMPPFR